MRCSLRWMQIQTCPSPSRWNRWSSCPPLPSHMGQAKMQGNLLVNEAQLTALRARVAVGLHDTTWMHTSSVKLTVIRSRSISEKVEKKTLIFVSNMRNNCICFIVRKICQVLTSFFKRFS